MQLDPQAYRSTRPHDPSDARPGRIRESERNSTLSQERAVSVAIHGEGQQIEDVQGNQFLIILKYFYSGSFTSRL